jgi:hypothetical protein
MFGGGVSEMTSFSETSCLPQDKIRKQIIKRMLKVLTMVWPLDTINSKKFVLKKLIDT